MAMDLNTVEDPETDSELDKVKKKYGALGPDIVVVTLERSHHGLGISLAGHKDRTKMAVFVCGLNPHGSAHKTGSVLVGDELLEVNGVVLHGRCHLNASAIIKGLAGPVFKLILHRRQSGLEDLAVKPITQFPVSLDDETPEQKYANFKGLRTIAIKKPGAVDLNTCIVANSPTQQAQNQGLGIMIIEGKHAEVGKGIFISDIQEGSPAEQAGLIVGDMILAVNKDAILGSGYDNAASILKKAEGIVTLVVCNPNLKEGGAAGPADDKTAAAVAEKPKEEKKLNVTFSDLPHPPGVTHLPPPAAVLHQPQRTHYLRHAKPKPTSISPSTSIKHKEPEEPPPDPATAVILPGKEVTIEINRDKTPLGLNIVGGNDTKLGGIFVHDIFAEGAVAKDTRLKFGDQILELNGEDFRNISNAKALAVLRLTPAKVKIVVLRENVAKEDDLVEIVDLELTKKAGKGFGLSLVGRKCAKGVFVSDLVPGGIAATDGRILKGDQIYSVDGVDLKDKSEEEAATVMKCTSGKVPIKVARLKSKPCPSSSAPAENVCSLINGSSSKLLECSFFVLNSLHGLASHDEEDIAVDDDEDVHVTCTLRTRRFSYFSFRKKKKKKFSLP